MQLDSLGKTNFKGAKSLTTWDYLQQIDGIAQDSPRMFVVFLGNALEENKVLSLMKVPQWCVFTRSMDAATPMLGCDETINQIRVEDLVFGLIE